MDTNSAIFTSFSMTASALLLNSNCGIRGARQAQLAGDGGQGHEATLLLAGRTISSGGTGCPNDLRRFFRLWPSQHWDSVETFGNLGGFYRRARSICRRNEVCRSMPEYAAVR